MSKTKHPQLPSAKKTYGYSPALCEAHGARFTPGTYEQVPHWTELTDPDDPVPCEGCATAIMRQAGVL